MEERLKEYGKEKNVTVNCEMVAATDFVTKLNAAIEAEMCIRDSISIFQMFHACEDERFIAEFLIGFVLSCGHKKCISCLLYTSRCV